MDVAVDVVSNLELKSCILFLEVVTSWENFNNIMIITNYHVIIT
jgi:hypothetical protein